MMVIVVDGQDVCLVEVDEFQIGNVEIYDVIVELKGVDVFVIIVEVMDWLGMGVVMFVIGVGVCVVILLLCDLLFFIMVDMGMNYGVMFESVFSGGMVYGGMDYGVMVGMDYGLFVMVLDLKNSLMDMGLMLMCDMLFLLLSVKVGLGFDMVLMNLVDCMDDFGIGFVGVGYCVFIYKQFVVVKMNLDIW